MKTSLPNNPIDVGFELNKALQYHQCGQLIKAEEIYHKILKINPDQPDALHLLGLIAHVNGDPDIAIGLIKKAIGNYPENAVYHYNLGNILGSQRKFGDAISCYRKAIQIKPAYAEAYNDLGNIYWAKDMVDVAAEHYQQAVRLKPDYAEAINNLGNIFWARGAIKTAVQYYEQAIRLKPDYAEAYNNLGNAFQTQGDIDRAIRYGQKAVELKNNYPEAYNNLGNSFWSKGEFDTAIQHYEQAIRLKPDYIIALSNLGERFQDLGKIDDASGYYKKVYELKPKDGLRVKMALMLPPIYLSIDEMMAYRQQCVKDIDALLGEKLTIPNPVEDVGPPTYYLPYHGLNDREIQKKAALLLESSCEFSENVRFSRGQKNKINVGFVSTHFKNHTIGKLNRGFISHLNRDDFTATVFSIGQHDDDISNFIKKQADSYFVLPDKLSSLREVIGQQGIDILFYTDIGMDPITYYLAFSRLAPVQCVTWGHPVTTGIKTIDYFISTEDLETDNSHSHYTEKLVRLKSSPTFYYNPSFPPSLKNRDHFDLPRDKHIYLCPQSLFKFHPDFDAALAEILRRDVRGRLVLINTKYPHWIQLLMARFRKSIPDVLDRVMILPRQNYHDFLNLIAVSDVMLDTFFFGGGNTTYEGLAAGTPIVTLPTEFLRGRITYAIYKKMNVMDCVASTAQEYVDIAVRLGTDASYREMIHEKIREHVRVIYEDIEPVRELERFFKWAVTRASENTDSS